MEVSQVMPLAQVSLPVAVARTADAQIRILSMPQGALVPDHERLTNLRTEALREQQWLLVNGGLLSFNGFVVALTLEGGFIDAEDTMRDMRAHSLRLIDLLAEIESIT